MGTVVVTVLEGITRDHKTVMAGRVSRVIPSVGSVLSRGNGSSLDFGTRVVVPVKESLRNTERLRERVGGNPRANFQLPGIMNKKSETCSETCVERLTLILFILGTK
ncbi:MAG: hypothetical protein C7B43_15720 [Sulfobacillus benefaciens]|uniref:Uncharacterized protein n=1 Tax=Sulfobacillus benefaciens TaxID=453960 RepID=A0A2T2WUM5_9FIRM|nr:MAG: hypothetical protein C7B43_15720 [Sulfobacillus benefaciens]